tara:strand:+ start:834 stop:1424 length:591 start_codon:yes stop_codon:yes gene_type:complete
MGGGGAEDPKEAVSKQALAEQAAIALKSYGETFVPLENQLIAQTRRSLESGAYDAPMANAALRTAAIYEPAQAEQQRAAFSRGFDPGSGAFQSESDALSQAKARGMGLSGADAGITQTDRGLTGMSNLVAIGQGLAGDAMSGQIDVAQRGVDRALGQAQRDFSRSSSLQNLVGTGAGMAFGYGLNPYSQRNPYGNV